MVVVYLFVWFAILETLRVVTVRRVVSGQMSTRSAAFVRGVVWACLPWVAYVGGVFEWGGAPIPLAFTLSVVLLVVHWVAFRRGLDRGLRSRAGR
jgi:hypothetical protein